MITGPAVRRRACRSRHSPLRGRGGGGAASPSTMTHESGRCPQAAGGPQRTASQVCTKLQLQRRLGWGREGGKNGFGRVDSPRPTRAFLTAGAGEGQGGPASLSNAQAKSSHRAGGRRSEGRREAKSARAQVAQRRATFVKNGRGCGVRPPAARSPLGVP